MHLNIMKADGAHICCGGLKSCLILYYMSASLVTQSVKTVQDIDKGIETIGLVYGKQSLSTKAKIQSIFIPNQTQTHNACQV